MPIMKVTVTFNPDQMPVVEPKDEMETPEQTRQRFERDLSSQINAIPALQPWNGLAAVKVELVQGSLNTGNFYDSAMAPSQPE